MTANDLDICFNAVIGNNSLPMAHR